MDFVGKRKFWYSLSIALILLALVSLFVQGLNLSIDFTGGSLLHLRFEDSTVSSENIRGALKEFGLEKSLIQEGNDQSFTVKTIELEQSKQDEVLAGLENEVGKFELLRSEKVGPVIGSELRRGALLALVIASVLQIIYITVRFEFKFAIAAIIALMHDVIIALGFFSIFQFEVDSSYVAAVLTIIGYSINDTIVIFDRIRENMKNKHKVDLGEVVNSSLKQTLVRSINTSLAVAFVLVALLVLGGETTKNFSLAMLVGVISGAYSSIFIASTLWYDFRMKGQKAKTVRV